MKNCAVCGKPHPDDVTTSHHPIPCFPNCSLCRQKGNSPDGCVWMRTLTFPAGTSPLRRRFLAALAQAEMETENGLSGTVNSPSPDSRIEGKD